MDHFKVEQWADFARQVTAPDVSARMQRHLDSGCRDCARSLSTIVAMVKVGKSDFGRLLRYSSLVTISKVGGDQFASIERGATGSHRRQTSSGA